MPMSLHEKLRLYLADKRATFADDGISWTDTEGPHLLVAVDGPLSASHVIDGHVRALAMGARLHVAYAGEANPVAQRTAARFQAELLDAASLPEAPPRMPWGDAPAAAPEVDTAAPILEPGADVDRMPWHPAPLHPPAAAASGDRLVLAHSEPAPQVAHAERGDDAMPWGEGTLVAEPTVELVVDPIDMLALPWLHEMEGDAEELPAGRATRAGPAFRPTQQASWGLPWPRPVAPTDGLAIADPRIWRAPERLMAVREELDRVGAPSFGAAKPEGSAWLKRVSEYGPL